MSLKNASIMTKIILLASLALFLMAVGLRELKASPSIEKDIIWAYPTNLDISELLGASPSIHSKKDNVLTIDLDQGVKGPGAYKTLIKELKSLTETDRVVLNINSPGGSVMGGIPLLNALTETKAYVEVNVTGGAFSMAAALSCSGDEINMGPGTLIMFHDYSVGNIGGKGNELTKLTAAIGHSLKELISNSCSKLLTPKEIDSFMNGTDLYLYKSDVESRMKANKE